MGKRLKGKDVVSSYAGHADTPSGRLRHDLLFMYYKNFIAQRKVRQIIDIGAGSGLLVKRLLDEFSGLKAILLDDDQAMIDKAKEYLSDYSRVGRLKIIRAGVKDLPEVLKANRLHAKTIISFNHVIEYIPRQIDALKTLAAYVPGGGFLGIMYLNNSHEAFRKLFFNDNIRQVSQQLKDRRLNLFYFGKGKALDTNILLKVMRQEGMEQVEEYGLRCVSDFKPHSFNSLNYKKMLELEFSLGKHLDFIGLSRYRLKFFRPKK